MVDYIGLIPVAAIVFAAGAIYQKVTGMSQDIKDFKKDNGDIKKQLNDLEHEIKLLEPLKKLLYEVGLEKATRMFKGENNK